MPILNTLPEGATEIDASCYRISYIFCRPSRAFVWLMLLYRGLTPPSVFFRTFGAFPQTQIVGRPIYVPFLCAPPVFESGRNDESLHLLSMG